MCDTKAGNLIITPLPNLGNNHVLFFQKFFVVESQDNAPPQGGGERGFGKELKPDTDSSRKKVYIFFSGLVGVAHIGKAVPFQTNMHWLRKI